MNYNEFMKKLLLLSSVLLVSISTATFASILGSDLHKYEKYETYKSINRAFGLGLGVIYTNDWIKPTPVMAQGVGNTVMENLITLINDDLEHYDKGNRVKGENSPSYLKSFRLLFDQNKKTFQITAFSNEAQGFQECKRNQIDFMIALDRKYNLMPDYQSEVKDFKILDPPPSFTVSSQINTNRRILISCEVTKPLCDNVFAPDTDCKSSYTTFKPDDSEWRLVIKYRDIAILSDYRQYINDEAIKEKNKTLDGYDL